VVVHTYNPRYSGGEDGSTAVQEKELGGREGEMIQTLYANMNLKKKKKEKEGEPISKASWARGYNPVIPAIWQGEVGGSWFKVSPGKVS
jgi:hypothetical protein